jgi:hypothetical protein
MNGQYYPGLLVTSGTHFTLVLLYAVATLALVNWAE